MSKKSAAQAKAETLQTKAEAANANDADQQEQVRRLRAQIAAFI